MLNIIKLFSLSLTLILASCEELKDDFSIFEDPDLPSLLDSDKKSGIEIQRLIADGVDVTDSELFVGSQDIKQVQVVLLAKSEEATSFQLLDNEKVLAESTSPLLALEGNLIKTFNPKTLKIIAKNDNTSGSKNLAVRKIKSTSINITNPSKSSVTLDCSQNVQNFSLNFEKPELKREKDLAVEWFLDGKKNETKLLSITSGLTTQSIYTFNCAEDTGVHAITAHYSDDFTQDSFTWTVVINDPSLTKPDPVAIVGATPTTDPVVMVNGSEKTFVVAVNPGSGNVSFDFKLNNTQIYAGSNPYVEVNGTALSGGNHQLVVTATNETGSDSHVFNLRKNSPTVFSNHLPDSGVGVSASCLNDPKAMSATVTDADNDAVTFRWLLNGVESTAFNTNSSGYTSNTTFTADCTLVGTHTITAEVDDGHEKTFLAWVVTITNPIIATINSYTPSSNNVTIVSTGSQLFSIDATGKNPLNYKWELDGTEIPGATSNTFTVSAGGFGTGTYNLRASVLDSTSSDHRDWTVKVNAPPVLANHSPTNAITFKMNHAGIRTLEVDGSDANSDTISYTWLLDGAVSGFIAANNTATGSQAVLAPSDAIIGQHTIEVRATDGDEIASYAWSFVVNHFSEACNTLEAGEICTVAGFVGIGDGEDPTNEKVRVEPIYIEEDGSGNLFVADASNDVVWFFNRSGSALERIGTIVPSGKVKIVAGKGSQGYGANGNTALNWPLYGPVGLAYDPASDTLFVGEYNIHRVIRFDTNGSGTHVFGRGGGSENNNLKGTDSRCHNPWGMDLDVATEELFVACLGTDRVKRVTQIFGHEDDIRAFTIVKNGGTDNAVAGNAQTDEPRAVKLGPDGNLYMTESRSNCSVRVWNRSGSTLSYFGGSITVAPNYVQRLFSNGCNTTTGALNGIRIHQPYDLDFLYDQGSSVIKGFFTSSRAHHRLFFVNNSASAITIGDRTVSPNEGQVIAGTGAAEFNGDGLYGKNTNLWEPESVYYNPATQKLIIGDNINRRVRSLDTSIDQGTIQTIMGTGKTKNGYSGDATTPANKMLLNYPTAMTFRDGDIYYSDRGNDRIRKVDLLRGEVVHAMGEGNGHANESDLSTARMVDIWDMQFLGDTLFMVDYQGGVGINRTCQLRAANFSTAPVSLFGRSLFGEWVSSIMGNYGLGCQYWNEAAYDNEIGTNMALREPIATAAFADHAYVASFNDSCISKIQNSDGRVSNFLGLCRNRGNVDGDISGTHVRIDRPRHMLPDPRYLASENMFLADRYYANPSQLKYVNQGTTDVTIMGVTIPAGEIRSFYSAGSTRMNNVAAFENQICVSSGDPNSSSHGSHNVICLDRDANFALPTIVIGSPTGTTNPGGGVLGSEQEGVDAPSAKLYTPYGLTFDLKGNLYIADYSNHVIRKVKRWF